MTLLITITLDGLAGTRLWLCCLEMHMHYCSNPKLLMIPTGTETGTISSSTGS